MFYEAYRARNCYNLRFISSRYFDPNVKYSILHHLLNTIRLAIQSTRRHSVLDFYVSFNLQRNVLNVSVIQIIFKKTN